MVSNLEKPKVTITSSFCPSLMSEEGLFVCGENSQKMVDKDHCQKGNSPEPKIRSLNFRVTILRCVSGDNIKLYAVVFTK